MGGFLPKGDCLANNAESCSHLELARAGGIAKELYFLMILFVLLGAPMDANTCNNGRGEGGCIGDLELIIHKELEIAEHEGHRRLEWQSKDPCVFLLGGLAPL